MLKCRSQDFLEKALYSHLKDGGKKTSLRRSVTKFRLQNNKLED